MAKRSLLVAGTVLGYSLFALGVAVAAISVFGAPAGKDLGLALALVVPGLALGANSGRALRHLRESQRGDSHGAA